MFPMRCSISRGCKIPWTRRRSRLPRRWIKLRTPRRLEPLLSTLFTNNAGTAGNGEMSADIDASEVFVEFSATLDPFIRRFVARRVCPGPGRELYAAAHG